MFERHVSHFKQNGQTPLLKRQLGEYVTKIFPDVKRAKLNSGKVIYKGLRLNFFDNDKPFLFSNLEETCTSTGFFKIKSDADHITFGIQSGYNVNGHSLLKEATFTAAGKWYVFVNGKLVDPQLLGLDDNVTNHSYVSTILNTVRQASVCKGRTVSSKKDVSKTGIVQEWVKIGDENTFGLQLTSRRCSGLLPFLSRGVCKSCSTQTIFETPKMDIREVLKELDPLTVIKEMFPGASDIMVQFLLAQKTCCENMNLDARGRRWDKDIIQVALTLWNRSPKGYASLRNSGMLILPSENLLQRYKNCFEQKEGLHDEMFQWMLNEIRRNKADIRGGLILDEMSIQSDIVLTSNNGKMKLTGMVDLGDTARAMRLMDQHCNEIRIATHVLQFIYLGYDGFRFPFAFFPSSTASPAELYLSVWNAIEKCEEYEVKIDFVCMDGASQNRSFLQMHFPNKDAKSALYTTANPFTVSSKIVMVMDPSHNFKKVRNNIYSSGDRERCTRKLRHFETVIVWDHWYKAYQWDKCSNTHIRVHRKLTDEHFNLDSSSKMRNHLAEDVLDSNMLHLMEVYQSSLHDGGPHLKGTIELLKQTSLLIQTFRDRRPIHDINDDRLLANRNALKWMTQWEDSVKALDIQPSEKAKMLFSHETRNDISSMIIGFEQVCQKRIQLDGQAVVPAAFNSDIVENFFCQQRATHHGSNSNPTVNQYRYGINATILGQHVVNKKSNVTLSKHAAKPYSFNSPVPLIPRKIKKPQLRV